MAKRNLKQKKKGKIKRARYRRSKVPIIYLLHLILNHKNYILKILINITHHFLWGRFFIHLHNYFSEQSSSTLSIVFLIFAILWINFYYFLCWFFNSYNYIYKSFILLLYSASISGSMYVGFTFWVVGILYFPSSCLIGCEFYCRSYSSSPIKKFFWFYSFKVLLELEWDRIPLSPRVGIECLWC